ncbi:MAG: YgjV family protein [Oscillospiraceae bacterium]|nr:YgjV family protein [Oscillospiraceae bacterium]
MIGIVIGNVASLLATITDSISATRKTTKGMLLMQMLSQSIFTVAALALKGYSGAVQNVVGILRNLVAISGKTFKGAEWVFAGLGVVFGLYFNNLGVVGLLPILAGLEYSLAVFRFKDDERALKVAFIVMNVLFVIYNCFVFNVVGAISSTVVVVSTIAYLVKNKKSAQ